MQLLHGHGMLKTRHVGYVGWLSMVVVPIANSLGMIKFSAFHVLNFHKCILGHSHTHSKAVLFTCGDKNKTKLPVFYGPLCFGVRVVWGACNHAFHLHCILKWVNSQTSQAHCPMCRREWQFKEQTKIGGYLCFWTISWKVAYLEFWTIRCLSFNHCLEGRESFWIVLEAGFKFVCLYCCTNGRSSNRIHNIIYHAFVVLCFDFQYDVCLQFSFLCLTFVFGFINICLILVKFVKTR